MERVIFISIFTEGRNRIVFFKTKICRNKLYIYPEVEAYVAKQSPAELIELGFVVLETSPPIAGDVGFSKLQKGYAILGEAYFPQLQCAT